MDLATLYKQKNNLRVRQLLSAGVNHPLFKRVLYAKQLQGEYMKYKSEYATPSELKEYYKDKEKKQNGL